MLADEVTKIIYNYQTDDLLLVFLLIITLDQLFGFTNHVTNKTYVSEISSKGLIKKIMLFAIALIIPFMSLFTLDDTMSNYILIGYIAIISYNEIISSLAHIRMIGLTLPGTLNVASQAEYEKKMQEAERIKEDK